LLVKVLCLGRGLAGAPRNVGTLAADLILAEPRSELSRGPPASSSCGLIAKAYSGSGGGAAAISHRSTHAPSKSPTTAAAVATG
jgi:hypothetical protein